ncbi:alpha/beta hydrolase [Pseudomonas sp. NPDC089569]|uniref:alpha/beta hydrolase n=1 Tax=Pseudomonas sp. NPDC089569 TaxID=3390722 RepID=UPI003CFEE0B2
MALDPKARYVLDLMAAANRPPLHTLSPQAARVALDLSALAGPAHTVARVEARNIPGASADLPARFYIPDVEGPLGVLVYFHGGGWVVGDLDAVDVPCRHLANRARCLVVSVDYRLAPEHRFPCAVQDAYAAVRWVHGQAANLNVDPTRIAVGGDSAGGNLAAVVALMARERGEFSLCHQLLFYPVTDHDFDTGSYRDNAEGYFLSRETMMWFWDQYADPQQRCHPHASPLRAENLTGLPPALVITAQYDPLRDEGEAYARRLAAAGVPVTLSRYDGMIHGFCWMPGVLEQGGRALDEAAQALAAAFYP